MWWLIGSPSMSRVNHRVVPVQSQVIGDLTGLHIHHGALSKVYPPWKPPAEAGIVCTLEALARHSAVCGRLRH